MLTPVLCSPHLRVVIRDVIVGDATWGCRLWVRNPDCHSRAQSPAVSLERSASVTPVRRHS
ncbi:hypothetical protein FYJ43_01580 [Cutibacterium sp. WCA-380-WT-3A]|uniref:Uncharacterized protein n=1 Tax=Cutibacterium porci TaxID=2605781 RepID=A0A7K0J4A3_9ACTN|nr:hypothetical protein [Cutibacterium porci]